MMRSLARRFSCFAGAFAALLLAAPQDSAAQDGDALVTARCVACHAARADGTLERVHDARKTPEAWDMTLFRMANLHGVEMTPDEKRKLVKQLSDTHGLAPAETEGYRYILEKTPGVTDTGPDDDLTQMCGRCHSFARVALQRRDEAEWLKLVHFHLGQFPTTEYQALGRDRDWWGIASRDMPKALVKLYPFETEAWEAWKSRPAPDLSGSWRLVGRQPGKGAYDGTLKVSSKGDDSYAVEAELTFGDGTTVAHSGNAILYSGHEWRAGAKGDDGSVRQVASVAEDGKSMTGRWFYAGNDVIGGSMTAVRLDSGPQILAVAPAHVRQGGSAQVVVSGIGLSGTLDFGPGISIKTISATERRVVAEISALENAATGAREAKLGEASLAGGLVVYDKVDRVAVDPPQTFARVGDNGGPIAAVPAQFEAVGYMAGADGEAGTEDDQRIGVLEAAWSVENFDEVAAALEDAKYAGTIGPSGLFSPAGAGPNPARKMSTNNAGNLTVVAVVDDNGKTVEGRAQLFVTVQRFVDPPIR